MKGRTDNRINGLHKELRNRMYAAGLQSEIMHEGNNEGAKKFLDGLKELVGFAALVVMEEERVFFPGLFLLPDLWFRYWNWNTQKWMSLEKKFAFWQMIMRKLMLIVKG